jgi:hypothetical protein
MIAWLIWKGDIFRVPLTTLYRNKKDGGWELIDWTSKCQTLFLYQTRHAMERKGTITAEWFREWNLHLKGTHSPHCDEFPKCVEYLRHLAMASAYVPERVAMETKQAYRRRSYATLHEMNTCAVGTCGMRIQKLVPNTRWNIVWEVYSLCTSSWGGKIGVV